MSALFNMLIVEDDPLLSASLKLMIPDGFKVFTAQRPELIPDHVVYDAAIVDMHLTSRIGENPDGPQVIKSLVKRNPYIEIVSISGDLNQSNMEMAIKAGAQRFLSKPLHQEEVTLVLEKTLAYLQLRKLSFIPQKSVQFIGQSEAIETIRKKIASFKTEKKPILIEGETGTGKEVVAQIINQQEGQIPFVSINCAAIPENLFEAELFGYMKGSFTGADTNKIGLADAAHGGDLFLDEIEALPLSQQAKLLRFLESGEIRKVGAKETHFVQTRILVASNQPLKKMVEEKKFREDLYFRLSSQQIEIPPLRQRLNDIADLAHYFLEKEKPKRNKQLSHEALEVLKNYSWPGNVRELKRVCEQLVLTSPLPVIREIDVTAILHQASPSRVSSHSTYELSLDDFIQQQEKNFLTYHLTKNPNLDDICNQLKISKSSLYKKIKDYGIQYQ